LFVTFDLAHSYGRKQAYGIPAPGPVPSTVPRQSGRSAGARLRMDQAGRHRLSTRDGAPGVLLAECASACPTGSVGSPLGRAAVALGGSLLRKARRRRLAGSH